MSLSNSQGISILSEYSSLFSFSGVSSRASGDGTSQCNHSVVSSGTEGRVGSVFLFSNIANRNDLLLVVKVKVKVCDCDLGIGLCREAISNKDKLKRFAKVYKSSTREIGYADKRYNVTVCTNII